MDSRLIRVMGLRPAPLLRSDLPDLARAIALHKIGKVQVSRILTDGLECVVFSGYGNVVVQAADWDRLLPYLTEGYLEPQIYPTPRIVVRDPLRDDPSLVTSPYKSLYDRILSLLQELFTNDYPRS